MKYEIRIRDGLNESWTKWFDGWQIENDADGETVMSGTVADQAALHGLLAKIRDLGLTLLAVHCLDRHDGVRGCDE